MLSLPNLQNSDEEIITQAIRSAFPRPGPWLPPESMAAGSYWPNIDGIPIGQVWEIYAYLGPAQALLDKSGRGICNNGIGAGTCWMPSKQMYWIGASTQVVGEIGTPGLADTDLLMIGGQSSVVQMDISGWVLSGGECVRSTQAYVIRARRRFDLE